ncbi:MAG TPA: J domain-containing protein [Polyangiaceae bacterium]|nr:J domain-containing protein [Polyangiaceae bacterium]
MVEARALELLGVGQLEGVSREELRRAYLRAVKAHPPERDADGFREVREAYELLQGALQLQQFRASIREAEAHPIASDGSSTPNLGVTEAAVIAEPPEPAEQQEEKPSDPLASEFRELQSALEAEDMDRAGLSLAKLYESPGVPSEMLPPAGFGFRIALRLFESANPALARRLLSGFEEHSRRFGSASQLDTMMAARWVLLKELTRLSRLVEEPRVVAALAKGLLHDDLTEAARTVDRCCAQKPELADELAKYAPSMWGALLPYLQRTRKQQQPKSRWSLRWGGWVLVVVLSNGIRVCANATSSSTSSAHSTAPAPRRQPAASRNYVLTANLAFEMTQAVDARVCGVAAQCGLGHAAS